MDHSRSQSNQKLHVSVLTLIREKSLVPKCSRNKGNSCDISKGILQNDLCRFESYMPSQPVRSLQAMFRFAKIGAIFPRVSETMRNL